MSRAVKATWSMPSIWNIPAPLPFSHAIGHCTLPVYHRGRGVSTGIVPPLSFMYIRARYVTPCRHIASIVYRLSSPGGQIMSAIPRRIHKLVGNRHASGYILVMLLSFGLNVVLTRLYLAMTNYPQLGGGVFHIAHALWGGLLLVIAPVLLLMYVNRWVFTLSALLAGVGVGLFIDEVGKFITTQNDYFFPLAAPIIYVAFLLTVFVYVYT